MSEAVSVRDSLQAAMTELAPAEAAPVVVAPVGEEAPIVEAAPALEAEAPAAGARERGPDGKFLPKAEASAEAPPASPEPKIETAPAAGDEPQATETIRVPHALSAPLKAEFNELPAKWREAFVKQEDSIKAFKDEQQPKSARLNRYDEIMAPRAEKFALQGIDEFTAIKTLLAAQDFLERDPLGGIQHLARSYGVNLQSLVQQTNGAQPGPDGRQATTVDPRFEAVLQPLVQQVQTLQQQIDDSNLATQTAQLDRLTAEVQAFMDDPANLYVHNVEKEMEVLLRAKAATGIKDAYEKAIWASPEIRPLLLKAQQAEAAKKDVEAARQRKAQSAQQSAGSVTGSPSPGATAQRPGSLGNVRADLQAAMQEHGASI